MRASNSWKLGDGSGYSILQVEALALLMNSRKAIARVIPNKGRSLCFKNGDSSL